MIKKGDIMSTKIYNAYIFDKNYGMYELEQLLNPIKDNIKKMAIKMKKKWLMSEYFYYCDYLKVHGKEKCQKNADKIEPMNKLSKYKKQIWEDLVNEKFSLLFFDIDCYFSEKIQCNNGLNCLFNDYNASLQVIPLKDKILAMYFGNPDFFRECDFSFLNDYHYQNQCDKPEDIPDKAWKERKNDWDKAIGPDYIPANHGFSVELFNKEWGFGIINLKDIEKEFYPNMKDRVRLIFIGSYLKNYLKNEKTEKHKSWVKEKSKEIEDMLEPVDTIIAKFK